MHGQGTPQLLDGASTTDLVGWARPRAVLAGVDAFTAHLEQGAGVVRTPERGEDPFVMNEWAKSAAPSLPLRSAAPSMH